MVTQHKIKVKPISEEEAWTLFTERLGHDISLSLEVEQIAKSITKECDGLPLGIITMAGTMKGVDDYASGGMPGTMKGVDDYASGGMLKRT
jgi:disease resistance protein RPS2